MTIYNPLPGIPAQMSVMAAGLLPADVQVTGFGAGLANPTVKQLIAAGLLNPSAPASSLTFATPPSYGGT